jgi:hypothetical protein
MRTFKSAPGAMYREHVLLKHAPLLVTWRWQLLTSCFLRSVLSEIFLMKPVT